MKKYLVSCVLMILLPLVSLAGNMITLQQQLVSYFSDHYTLYKESIIPYDMWSDDSITKFVSKNIGFNNPYYIPHDLVKISGQHLQVSRPLQLRREALTQLQLLSEAFWKKFKMNIAIVSAYRSAVYQQTLRLNDPTKNFVAPAGHSEHQAGLAIDIFYVNDQESFMAHSSYKKYFERLQHHAHEYGFHNTYQKGVTVDTYHSEPWHWRYMGTGLATLLYDNGWTIAEYYHQLPIVY